MTTWEYQPGTFVGVVAGDAAVLIDVPQTEPLVRELLACLDGGPTMEEVVEVLLGQGLRRLGGFAAATMGSTGARVVVRGGFSAAVPGREPVLAAGLWTDQSLAGSTQVTLAGGSEPGATLPIGRGIVLAASLIAGVPQSTPEPSAPHAEEPLAEEPRAKEPLVEEPHAEERHAEEPTPSAPPVVLPAEAGPEAAAAPVPGWPWQQFSDTPAPAVPEPGADEVVVVAPVLPAPGGVLIESFPWAAPGATDLPNPVAASTGPPQAFDAEATEMTVDRSRLIEHAAASPSSVLVVAARCPAGHLSPAYANGCRVCHQPLPPQQPVELPRPQLGVLRLSNGDTVALDRAAILGRNPRLPAGYAGEQPNLVRLSDPGKDISSQHLEVTLDYWHVLVTDLGSTNGTEVILPGQMPITLRANDPMTIEPGTRVVLAGVFDFVFEVTG